MPKPAKKQPAAPKPEPVVDAEISAPAASASTEERWGEFADGTAHIVKAKAAKCGHRSQLVTVVGTLPEGRRPPCDKCAK